jgi:hypothetical protein
MGELCLWISYGWKGMIGERAGKIFKALKWMNPMALLCHDLFFFLMKANTLHGHPHQYCARHDPESRKKI